MELKTFPRDMSSLPIDKAHLRRCLVDGLFDETVECGGKTRHFYTYLTPGLEGARPCLIIASPDDTDVKAWIEEGFWTDFAAEHQVFLHFLVPEGSYDKSGADAEYMNKVFLAVQSRNHYALIPDTVYALGFGNGADIAQQAVMKMETEYSGLATFGQLTGAALLNAENIQKSLDMGHVELTVTGRKTQMPVWIFTGADDEVKMQLASYWRQQNNDTEERFSNDAADEIYFPDDVVKKSQINEERISQLRITLKAEGCPDRETFERVWKFLKRAARHRNYGIKALRRVQDPKLYGAELHTMTVDGYGRIWYEYVPEAVKAAGKKVPLVLCMHGRGGSAETFISLSNMNQVAEERGFIVCFPEAGVYQQKPGGLRNILLWDGEYLGERIDDVKFLRELVADVSARQPVDETRIYACGQSSGGMMTSLLGIRANDLFAAVAPWSGLGSVTTGAAVPEKLDPKIPFLLLYGDTCFVCADNEKGKFPYKASAMITPFLEGIMKAYDLDPEELSTWSSGEITYYAYHDKNGIPMLTVGRVADMPHANYPRESWLSYDEFLCKWTKKDGKLYYMGREVK